MILMKIIVCQTLAKKRIWPYGWFWRQVTQITIVRLSLFNAEWSRASYQDAGYDVMDLGHNHILDSV